VQSDKVSLDPVKTPLIILAQGCFGESASKLALGVLRYGAWPILAVIDSTRAGQTVREATGIPSTAPVVPSLQSAMDFYHNKPEAPQAKALLLGTAPPGGQLPAEWLPIIKQAIEAGLHIINGLHFFLSENPQLVSLAQQYGVQLWDVRDPDYYGEGKFKTITLRKPRPANVRVITMVGTDCAVGKMHTALELHKSAHQAGVSTAFVATGQTGILITGHGVPLDRVIGDFMAGAVETCINEEIARLESLRPRETHWIFVEGQGSLVHPAYSGVTLALLHGSNPDAMILCHKSGMRTVRHYPNLPLPSLPQFISMYELAAAYSREVQLPKARILGIAINTVDFKVSEAMAYLEKSTQKTGLTSVDPVRQGSKALWKALQSHDFSVLKKGSIV
jgi:uncharacterized NAD-dependent epimerase/dehydratase family protein